MYQSLYRKYRPSTFGEIVGQDVIVKTLENAISNNALSHAYLFTGPRGTGKTSVAKILAKTVNCLNIKGFEACDKCVNCTQYNNKQFVDILEIDAASNNGVEEIREIKSKIDLIPSGGRYKVYIIDEVHMLSTGAFNALLKTLEEPPEHVIFILATTDPHKIPLTILSRCQRFDFKKIADSEIFERIKEVAKKENIKIDEESLKEISVIADGGMRDALSLLDQASTYSDNITIEDIHQICGTIDNRILEVFVSNIIDNNYERVFEEINELNKTGKDFYKITEQIVLYLRNVLINNNIPNYFNDKNNYDLKIDNETLILYIKQFNQLLYEMKTATNLKLLFEITIIGMMNKPSNCNKKEKIRINNTLCNFNKKEFNDKKEQIENILNLMDIVPINGIIKAYGSDYFIILYENEDDVISFNNNLDQIDLLLYNETNKKIRGIAVNNHSWDKIKNDYNNHKIKYEYIEEE